MRATWRSRAVGVRATPRASATSWPCAQVSMSRAEAMEATLIAGPYQGILVPSGASRSTFSSRCRPSRQRASRASGAWAATKASAASSTNASGAARALATSSPNRSGSVAASRATSSVQLRWAIWWAMLHRSAGVGPSQSGPSNAPTRSSSSSPSSRRSSITATTADTCAPLGTGCGVQEHGSAPRNNQARLHDLPTGRDTSGNEVAETRRRRRADQDIPAALARRAALASVDDCRNPTARIGDRPVRR